MASVGLEGVDWGAGERHFIQETSPRMTLRQYAAATAEFAWTNYQAIGYDTFRQYAKANLWLTKRARYVRENHPGLAEDVEIAYGLVMNKLVDEGETLNAIDLARLSDQIVKLQELLLAHRPPTEEEVSRESFTRDDVLDIAKDIEELDANALIAEAQRVIERRIDQ